MKKVLLIMSLFFVSVCANAFQLDHSFRIKPSNQKINYQKKWLYDLSYSVGSRIMLKEETNSVIKKHNKLQQTSHLLMRKTQGINKKKKYDKSQKSGRRSNPSNVKFSIFNKPVAVGLAISF